MARGPEIRRPLPDIADHVVDAVAIRRERLDRRRALITIERLVLVRKRPLPGVGHLFSRGRQFIAPGEFRPLETAARRVLPLGLGRQFLARPTRVSLRVAIGDMHDRVVVEPADRTARPVRPAPVGAEFEPPPLRPIVEIDWRIGRREHERAGLQHFRQGARIVLRIRRNLGEGDVVRGVDELAELAVRHRRGVDPECADADPVDRRFLGIVPVRTHAELPRRNEDHLGERVLPRSLNASGNLAL